MRRTANLLIRCLPLLALAADAAAAGPALGRLFFTPQERAALEALRQRSGVPGEGAEATGGVLTLNGFVQRSSGKTTAWINGIPRYESEKPQGVEVLGAAAEAGRVPIRLPGSARTVRLKVGQTLDTGTGKIKEGYQP